MWEGWEDSTCDTARSRDHAFMGTVDDWLFAHVAGIQSTSPGFRTVQIDPSPVGGLTHASGYETTPLGRVSSKWTDYGLSLIHISEPTRLGMISYAVFCLKKKKK